MGSALRSTTEAEILFLGQDWGSFINLSAFSCSSHPQLYMMFMQWRWGVESLPSPKPSPPLDSSRTHCSGLCGGWNEGSGGTWYGRHTAQARVGLGAAAQRAQVPAWCGDPNLFPSLGRGPAAPMWRGACSGSSCRDGGSGRCCRGVRWGCCRDGGLRKLLPSL